MCGIFQGDGLCPFLFCLAVNPLSWRLRSFPGYIPGNRTLRNEEQKIVHLYYIDDLKYFAQSEEQFQMMTMVVVEGSKDMGLDLGYDKCAGVIIQRGKVIPQGKMPVTSEAAFEMLDGNQQYKFLGLEENGRFDRQAIVKNVMLRTRQRLHSAWGSDLSGTYKVRATNSFAVPKSNYTMWTLKWNISERINGCFS